MAIGGALKYDHAAIWQRVVDLAGGPGSRFAVFASASDNPERSAESIIAALEKHGAKAAHVPVAVKLAKPRWQEAVNDPRLIEAVAQSTGVYFAGGAQERYTQVLLDAKGAATPMLEAIRAVKAKGGVIAGSSAGAAVMSETMFLDPKPVLEILKHGIDNVRDLGRGLGFAGPGLVLDQHFLRRGRIGRLLPALVASGVPVGLGVEEDTAAIICGNEVEIIGAKGALLADVSGAKAMSAAPFRVEGAKLTYLDRGDRYDLNLGRVTPSPQKLGDKKLDPRDPNFKPYFKDVPFTPDILGDGVIVAVMGRLLDSPATSAIGLAFDGAALVPGVEADRKPPGAAQVGFEFVLRRGPGTHGYFTGAFGGEDYTIVDLTLDINPVTLTRPLYSRLLSSNKQPASKPSARVAAPPNH